MLEVSLPKVRLMLILHQHRRVQPPETGCPYLLLVVKNKIKTPISIFIAIPLK